MRPTLLRYVRPVGSELVQRDQRYTIGLWVSVIQPNSSAMQARIANISVSGARLECLAPLHADLPLQVIINDQSRLRSRIVWTSTGVYGCEFESRLTDAELMAIIGGV